VNGPAATLVVPSGGRPLAFVSGGTLFMVDDPPSVPRALTGKGALTNPQWSKDGRYLAYLSWHSGGTTADAHIVAASGTPDRVVGTGVFFAMQWSPTADLLALTPALTKTSGGLLLVGPEAPAVQVVPADVAVFSAAFSPDGTRIAYDTQEDPGVADQLRVVDTTTRQSTLIRTVPGGAGLIMAGWWPDGRGLLWWVDPQHSRAAENAGLSLQSMALPGGRALDLGHTLVFLKWLAWAPDRGELLFVDGTGVYPWSGKHLRRCDPASARCVDLPQPDQTVRLDPTWSADGTRIAFVQAPAGPTPATATVKSWYRTRRLWTANADGNNAAPVEGASAGAAEPTWSRSGTDLAYATADAVETVPAGGGTPTRLAGPLSGNEGGAGPDGYGKTPWNDLPVWSPLVP
jgi:TolB protein